MLNQRKDSGSFLVPGGVGGSLNFLWASRVPLDVSTPSGRFNSLWMSQLPLGVSTSRPVSKDDFTHELQRIRSRRSAEVVVKAQMDSQRHRNLWRVQEDLDSAGSRSTRGQQKTLTATAGTPSSLSTEHGDGATVQQQQQQQLGAQTTHSVVALVIVLRGHLRETEHQAQSGSTARPPIHRGQGRSRVSRSISGVYDR
ncbi:unnamed protein product [Pleuronectes platessa]|uniref:Uncharacterized protein n=1 Tax=Pleuronectes platessa TaxID=8262 RepID=A0A9N7TLK0_PLEPL|nr:unnamed protein product [Pleuronectes platessa]